MATTYRIAVIGDWESVMGFRAIGLDTYPVTSAAEAKERVKELAKDRGVRRDLFDGAAGPGDERCAQPL